MSCSYRIGGVESALLNDVFFYVEDTPGEVRDPKKIADILESKGLVFKDGDTLYKTSDAGVLADLRAVNETARSFFGVTSDLLRLTEEGENMRVAIDDNTLALLYPDNNLKNISSKGSRIERMQQAEDEIDPLISEAFSRKMKVDTVTQQLITNLEKQIERLERLPQEKKVKSKVRELTLLKSKLRKIKQGHEQVSSFYDYVDYVYNLTYRANLLMDRIEDEYAVMYKNASNEDRMSILQNISDLKQTLDSFYNRENKDLSVISLLQNKLVQMQDDLGIKDEMVGNLQIAIAEMDELNDRYLKVAIPIHADLLNQYVPNEFNEGLYSTIERLEKALQDQDYTVPMQGLKRFDPRYRKIIKETGVLRNRDERRRRLIELNIAQLKEQIVGRESIIKELRETHQDASVGSLYTDPLVYSSELNLQLFATAIKTELLEAHNKTIDTKYELEQPFKKFRNWKGASENRPDKLFEDIIETVNVSKRDDKGNITTVPVLSFVQPYNMNKFNEAKTAAYKQFKEQFGYPENDPSQIDDFFASPEGKAYNAAVGKWHAQNTVPIKGAQDMIDGMIRERDLLDQARFKAFKEGREHEGKELSYQYHALDLEIKKVYRFTKDGYQIVGRMTRPNDNYINPKFKNMPAEAKEFYDTALETYKAHQKKLGLGALRQNSWDSFSYILPSIRKSAYDKLRDSGSTIRGFQTAAKDMFSDSFLLQETDTEFGELLDANGEKTKFVPRYFTNVVNANEVSKDVINSLVKFVDMANRYEAKAKMTGVVTIMHDAIASRDVLEMTESGNYVLDRTAQKLGYKLEKRKKGRDTNSYKQLESFIDNVIYGQSIAGNAKSTIAGKLSTSKLVGQASALTALARLGGNVLQATNQLTIDSVMNANEAWAGAFYSKKNLLKARGVVYTSMSEQGARAKFNKQSKLNKMMEMFDALQEFGGAFEKTAGTAAKKFVGFDAAFALQRSAEWTTTAEKMLAMAYAMEGKFVDKNGKTIKNAKGDPANLWDILEVNNKGRLVVNKDVANFGKKEIGAFTNKLHGVIKRTNQLKGQFDKTVAERDNRTRLLMLFRKYLNPAYRKRFGHRAGGYHLDVELQAVTEGYYQTAANALSSSWAMLMKKDFKGIAKMLSPISKEGDNKLQKENMRRFWHEQMYITLLGALTSALGAAMDDDDDYDNFAAHFLIYQAYRLQTELTAFRDPFEFIRIVENPTAASRLIRDAWELVTATQKHLGYWAGVTPYEDAYYQRRAGMFNRGDAKWVKEFLDVFPIASGVFKSADPEEASKYYLINK